MNEMLTHVCFRIELVSSYLVLVFFSKERAPRLSQVVHARFVLYNLNVNLSDLFL